MNHYLYIITNLMNGKKYIGKRSCWEQIEDDKYMGSGYLLAKAKEKYGIENFEKKILLVCETEEEAYEEEKKAIELVRAWENPMYYNIAGGGRGTGSGGSNPNAKSVVCLNTGEVFNASTEVKNKYNISKVAVCECCKEIRKSAGVHPKTGERLVWRWLEDYNQLNHQQIESIIKGCQNGNRKGIICLNTKDVFCSLKSVKEKYPSIKIDTISSCALKKVKSAGFCPDTSEKLVWRYIKDYEKMTQEEIKMVIKEANIRQHGNKKFNSAKRGIICINTLEIFSTLAVAAAKYNIATAFIKKCCQGEIETAGKHPVTGKKLKWMYYEDYENKYGKIDKEIV